MCTYIMKVILQVYKKFDSDGNFITKWGSEGTEDGQFDFANGVAVDSAGNVYVADMIKIIASKNLIAMVIS